MAAYETSLSRSTGVVFGPGVARQPITQTAIVAITTAMIDNANDDVGLFTLPAGAVVIGASISGTDMDTDGSPALAFDVGDSADEDRLIAAAAVGQAATYTNALAPAGHLYKYTAPTQIRAYVKTAAVAGAAGTLSVSVTYFVDPNFNTTALTAA